MSPPASRTPSMSRRSSFATPSRLNLPPSLRPSPSLSNLHIHSSPNAGVLSSSTSSSNLDSLPLPARDAFLDSSASSIVNMDMVSVEGILVQETDSAVDPLESMAAHEASAHDNHMDSDSASTSSASSRAPLDTSESAQLLREHLRKSLSTKVLSQELTSSQELSPQHPEHAMAEISGSALSAASRYAPREYFVLTNAGKPVFVSRPGREDDDNTASVIGVMQALISVFIDEGDKIRSINAGRTRITFLVRSPLYYVCVSSWGEPESTILSIVTGSQLKKIFERRTNFDLRRLLSGAESFVISMLGRVEGDLAMTTSSLCCLKLDPGLRKRIADSIMPASKIKDILYIILIANDKVLTLIRPRKHSIHPADLHIILNTINTPSVFNNPAPTSWIPFCLPKFNPTGFVNAFISFLRSDSDDPPTSSSSSSAAAASQSPSRSRAASPTPSSSAGSVLREEVMPTTEERASSSGSSDRSSQKTKSPSSRLNEHGVSLVCISGNSDVDAIRAWSEGAVKKLAVEGTLASLVHSFRTGQTTYSAADLGIPGLRHFVYKSRAQVQTTYPVFDEPYDTEEDRRRLITLYQIVHDAIHAKSGQEAPLKLQYLRTETESVMGWITQPFELYVAVSPILPKSAVVGAANGVTRWLKKEESKLFLRDAPVF